MQGDDNAEEIPSEIQSAEDIVLTVQPPLSEPKGRRQTLKLLAHIGKQQVLVLVDSGSIGTFVSDRLVKTLNLPTQPSTPATFRAADGGQLQCSERVPELQWWVQGHSFRSNAQVLGLKCYDMIVREDWLEAVSPVWVDYKTKEMCITHQGHRIVLQGVKDQLGSCPAISAKKLQGLIKHGGVACCIQLQETNLVPGVSDQEQWVCSLQPTDTNPLPDKV